MPVKPTNLDSDDFYSHMLTDDESCCSKRAPELTDDSSFAEFYDSVESPSRIDMDKVDQGSKSSKTNEKKNEKGGFKSRIPVPTFATTLRPKMLDNKAQRFRLQQILSAGGTTKKLVVKRVSNASGKRVSLLPRHKLSFGKEINFCEGEFLNSTRISVLPKTTDEKSAEKECHSEVDRHTKSTSLSTVHDVTYENKTTNEAEQFQEDEDLKEEEETYRKSFTKEGGDDSDQQHDVATEVEVSKDLAVSHASFMSSLPVEGSFVWASDASDFEDDLVEKDLELIEKCHERLLHPEGFSFVNSSTYSTSKLIESSIDSFGDEAAKIVNDSTVVDEDSNRSITSEESDNQTHVVDGSVNEDTVGCESEEESLDESTNITIQEEESLIDSVRKMSITMDKTNRTLESERTSTRTVLDDSEFDLVDGKENISQDEIDKERTNGEFDSDSEDYEDSDVDSSKRATLKKKSSVSQGIVSSYPSFSQALSTEHRDTNEDNVIDEEALAVDEEEKEDSEEEDEDTYRKSYEGDDVEDSDQQNGEAIELEVSEDLEASHASFMSSLSVEGSFVWASDASDFEDDVVEKDLELIEKCHGRLLNPEEFSFVDSTTYSTSNIETSIDSFGDDAATTVDYSTVADEDVEQTTVVEESCNESNVDSSVNETTVVHESGDETVTESRNITVQEEDSVIENVKKMSITKEKAERTSKSQRTPTRRVVLDDSDFELVVDKENKSQNESDKGETNGESDSDLEEDYEDSDEVDEIDPSKRKSPKKSSDKDEAYLLSLTGQMITGRNRDDIVVKLMEIFNRRIFDRRLPKLEYEWNARLRKTAGQYYSSSGKGDQDLVKLATKVLTSGERLRNTLLHEVCHCAVRRINNVKEGHGRYFKQWAKHVSKVFPLIPPITTRHNYEIYYKYEYVCQECGGKVRRHSPSVDITTKCCGKCHGRFDVLKDGKLWKKAAIDEQTKKSIVLSM
ncbi:unnamed protein product [Bursaphelenchus okinawaensis]|uniref:SprT-like domain-containing protein n=1 Tax=Bursaphelenchus okinawaensis TaxID=465554 RepID=A0A811K5A2_9BILA|nr:unnamed protein product [Bursaphelenchus okinawaensis]CAG9092825.1 unnamed protein product [Bursaphelenchus okinawaensis]